MNYLSICSGIESATMAWRNIAGWHPVAFAEIEVFPSAVLDHHYPETSNLGDITQFRDWSDFAIELLTGGTPCQSFSIAGLRTGLADPRGNLTLVYLAIADRYRPRWLVWENVPGVLSSNGGRDFGVFLRGLAELGYGWAYRTIDAQHCRVDGFPGAVPQRRRRVFVVGNSRDWRRAAAVLFDAESLRGNPPPRRETGQAAAPTLASSASASGSLDSDHDLAGELIAHSLRAEGFDASEDGSGRGIPLIVDPEGSAVRRLTPRECERLQGFPDDYTLIPYRGKPAADSPRYRALGNAMAVNVMRWIGRRIEMTERSPSVKST